MPKTSRDIKDVNNQKLINKKLRQHNQQLAAALK
jgi:hypothetical protein